MKPTQPKPESKVFAMIRKPTRFLLRVAAGAGLVAGVVFIWFGSEGLDFGVVLGILALVAGVAAGVASFIVQEAPMFWIEVDGTELRRVAPHAPTLAVPVAQINRLFILEVSVFQSSVGVVSSGYTRYELYIDGHLDTNRFAVDAMVGAIHHEAAEARGALLTGALESLRKTGSEIARACGATLEDGFRTLPMVVPVPAEPTAFERVLTPALAGTPGIDLKTKAAVARELGRVGSRAVEPLLQRAQTAGDAHLQEAAAEGLRRYQLRLGQSV